MNCRKCGSETDEPEYCRPCLFKWLNGNWEHRVKRSEAMNGLKPGESVVVDTIEYTRPKQACINCAHLDFNDKVAYCVANSSRGSRDKVKDLTKDQTDCDIWKFREMEE